MGEPSEPNESVESNAAASRIKVLVAAIVCFVTGGVLAVYYPEKQLLMGASFRIGLVLSAIWLAMPTKGRAAAWSNLSPVKIISVIAVVAAVAVPRFRILIPLLIVLAVLGFVLKPREAERPKNRAGKTSR